MKTKEFNAKKVKNNIVQWIRDWFKTNGGGCNAIVGISGGKDSSVVAALCVEALGRDRVIGVLMPNDQDDFHFFSNNKEAYELCDWLEIEPRLIWLKPILDESLRLVENSIRDIRSTISYQTKTNLPARLRMSLLYAVAQSSNGRVANTCNLSEDWVGYSTRYGDSVGDFSPLSNLTVTEVKAIGRELELPDEFVDKTPEDGLSGKTDEENFGFTYDVLDKYIRTGVCEDDEVRERIDWLHESNLFKLKLMDCFKLEKSDE